MQRGHANNFEFLLSQLGRLFAAGGQPQILKISPAISYPVSRGTAMLGGNLVYENAMLITKLCLQRFQLFEKLKVKL